MLIRTYLVALVAAALVASCTALGTTPVTPEGQAAASPAPKHTIITGSVKAPKDILPRVIPTGGGNVIPTGGGNVIPTGGGNYRVNALGESPLANATVFLADAAGHPFPGMAYATTDPSGQFTFHSVPAGHTFMVVVAGRDQARQKDMTLQTLVQPSELGATTQVDTSTSLVTLAVTEGQGQLGNFNAAAFRTATEATARHLDANSLPDLSDRSAVLARVEELSRTVVELKQAIEEIRQALQEIQASLEELKTQVANQANGPYRPPRPGSKPGDGYTPPAQGPGGWNGGARPGDCAPPQAYVFTLKNPYPSYPLRVDFVSPYGHLKAQLIFTAAGQTASAHLPTGCPHALTLRDANGTVLASEASWSIPLGSGTDVTLPF